MSRRGNLFRLFLPPPTYKSPIERLENAKAQARRFAARHSLDEEESEVVLSASVESLFMQIDGNWRAVVAGELERFRRARLTRGGNGDQEVDFVEEDRWPDAWLTERRLQIVYTPTLDPDSGLERNEKFGFGGSYLQVSHGNLTTDVSTVCYLSFLRCNRRRPQEQWKGSNVRIAESSRPLELKGIGGNLTENTVVNVEATLAGPTFDCAKAMMKKAASSSRDMQFWLAIGLPIDVDTPIPMPRPIGREQEIHDNVVLTRPAERLSLEILQTRLSNHKPPKEPTSIGRVMAVESP